MTGMEDGWRMMQLEIESQMVEMVMMMWMSD